MKKCTKCGVESDNFRSHKETRDGLSSWCRVCNNENTINYRKTKNGLITNIYGHQRGNSKKRGHKMPDYSRDELRKWIFSQPNFEELYTSWVESNYNRWTAPSCDRLDDSKPYTLDNLQLMTWQENDRKAHQDAKAGKISLGSPHKPVIQLDLQGNKIVEFISISQASRRTGVHYSSISAVCNNRLISAGSYKWSFKENYSDST